MQRYMLKSKIHRAVLTGADLHYEGSISIDPDLLEKADIVPGEQVHVLNINNGERLVTYAIEGKRGSRDIMLNGAAARLGAVGDLVIIITYCSLDNNEISAHAPTVVHVDAQNHVIEK